MKKVLFSLLVISLILAILFQSVFSANATIIYEEKDNLTRIAYKNYFNCTIKTSRDSFDGRAILFPGLLISFMGGVNVKRASGILVTYLDQFGEITFNNDEYGGNFNYAFIFSFNGYFRNWVYKAWRIFDINGTVKFARVCYNS